MNNDPHYNDGRYPWEQPSRIDNNTRNRNAQTPEERRTKLYEAFRKAKGKPDAELLFDAVREQEHDLVKMLLNRGADATVKTKNGKAALHQAVIDKHEDLVCMLLDYDGKNVDVQDDRSGMTPLHYAVQSDHIDIVRTLIDAGANVNAKATDGSSPMHYAARGGKVEILQLLLEAGADVDRAVNSSDNTPVFEAVKYDNVDAMKFLVKHGADTGKFNRDGATPMHYAAENGKARCVEALFEMGVDIKIKDKKGNTPFDVATWYSHNYELPKKINELERKKYGESGVSKRKTNPGGYRRGRYGGGPGYGGGYPDYY